MTGPAAGIDGSFRISSRRIARPPMLASIDAADLTGDPCQ